MTHDWNDHMDILQDNKFKRLYRMEEEHFRNLCHIVRPALERERTSPRGICSSLSTEEMLAVILRVLSGGKILYCWPYGLADSIIYAMILAVLRAISAGLNNIKFSHTESECRYQAELFRCLLYTSPSPRDGLLSRMPSSA